MSKRQACPECGMSMLREMMTKRNRNRSQGRSRKVVMDSGHVRCPKCGKRELAR